MVVTSQSLDRETTVRNVVEKYRWWDNLDIKDDLQETKSGFVPIFLNFDHDFNISSSIRNANWYNTNDIYIVGRRRVDMRGATGVQNYMNIYKEPDIESVINKLRNDGYRIIAAEIDDQAVSLVSYTWQEKSAVIFGQESLGISRDILDMCDDIVYVPGRGSVRSLNVANTSGMFLYDYSVKQNYIQ